MKLYTDGLLDLEKGHNKAFRKGGCQELKRGGEKILFHTVKVAGNS